MDKFQMFACMVALSGLPLCLSARCPAVYEVMGEILANCAGESLEYHRGKTLRGALNNKSRVKACNDYDQTMRCVEDIISSCSNNHDDSESQKLATQFKLDHENGFGKMCDQDDYFEEYLSHSACYKREQTKKRTEVCFENFTRSLDDESLLCSSITNLRVCVDDAVKPLCGPEASEFYFELCKHEVPSATLEHCISTPAPIPTSPAANNGAIRRLSVHVVWLLLLHIRILRIHY